MDFLHNSIAVAGMGRSGGATVQYLSSVNISSDQCDDGKDFTDCQSMLRSYAGVVVKSPGIPMSSLPGMRDSEVINDVELLLRITNKPVIMVTGTNGKSTVVTLLEHVLTKCGIAAVACGNNGVPVFQAYSPNVDLYVLELSSYQLENISSFSSMASVVLNIGVDHVDRYRDIGEYESVKRKIYENSKAAVHPVNSSGEMDFSSSINGYVVTISELAVTYMVGEKQILRNNISFLEFSDIPLVGRHNYLNLCAALCLLESISLQEEEVVAAIASFVGLPHRMEMICRDNQGRAWINDSKSTNLHSLTAALSSQELPVCLIMGGIGKGEDYASTFVRYSDMVGKLILFGQDADLIMDQSSAVSDVTKVENLAEAVRVALDFKGDILFSPACASFDQYIDFNERGEDFRRQVRLVMQC